MDLLFLNIGAAEMMMLLIVVGISLVPLVLAVFALIDVFKRDFRDKRTEHLLIVILIIFAPLVGSIVYFLALRNNYPKKSIIRIDHEEA